MITETERERDEEMTFYWVLWLYYVRYSAGHFYRALRSLILCFLSSSPEQYADLPYCPDDHALRRHIHSIPPQYVILNLTLVSTANLEYQIQLIRQSHMTKSCDLWLPPKRTFKMLSSQNHVIRCWYFSSQFLAPAPGPSALKRAASSLHQLMPPL